MRLLKIGRDASCDIVLHSDKVSALHAELTLLNSGDITLEDKGSRNGTFIMNQPIKPGKPVNVRRGDAIRFADVELQWSQVPMPEDNSAYKGVYGIGSHFNNDFQISGATVSRYHATVKHGRDGKMYLLDHSKNGTTVDGTKIPPHTPVRIKKSSAVVCGGVPVDLSRLPWPSSAWKYAVGIAAAVVLLAGVGLGVYQLVSQRERTWNTESIYNRYHSSVAMLVGGYHYEVTAGDLPSEVLAAFGIPPKFIMVDSKEGKKLVPALKEETLYAQYTGTGFFISEDGQMVTNLHVVKPWLVEGNIKEVESLCQRIFAQQAEQAAIGAAFGLGSPGGLTAYTSQIKVKGVLDGLFLVPQGRFFSAENAINCTILSAGEDINKDVALIQSDKMELPTKQTTYVNVADSMDVSDEALSVGRTMFTIGFPHGISIQDIESEKGLQVFCHSGHVSQATGEFSFNFDAVSAGGASGSPIFNDRGMLIGILNAGVDKENITAGIKAKYIKELLDSPHQK